MLNINMLQGKRVVRRARFRESKPDKWDRLNGVLSFLRDTKNRILRKPTPLEKTLQDLQETGSLPEDVITSRTSKLQAYDLAEYFQYHTPDSDGLSYALQEIEKLQHEHPQHHTTNKHLDRAYEFLKRKETAVEWLEGAYGGVLKITNDHPDDAFRTGSIFDRTQVLATAARRIRAGNYELQDGTYIGIRGILEGALNQATLNKGEKRNIEGAIWNLGETADRNFGPDVSSYTLKPLLQTAEQSFGEDLQFAYEEHPSVQAKVLKTVAEYLPANADLEHMENFARALVREVDRVPIGAQTPLGVGRESTEPQTSGLLDQAFYVLSARLPEESVIGTAEGHSQPEHEPEKHESPQWADTPLHKVEEHAEPKYADSPPSPRQGTEIHTNVTSTRLPRANTLDHLMMEAETVFDLSFRPWDKAPDAQAGLLYHNLQYPTEPDDAYLTKLDTFAEHVESAIDATRISGNRPTLDYLEDIQASLRQFREENANQPEYDLENKPEITQLAEQPASDTDSRYLDNIIVQAQGVFGKEISGLLNWEAYDQAEELARVANNIPAGAARSDVANLSRALESRMGDFSGSTRQKMQEASETLRAYAKAQLEQPEAPARVPTVIEPEYVVKVTPESPASLPDPLLGDQGTAVLLESAEDLVPHESVDTSLPMITEEPVATAYRTNDLLASYEALRRDVEDAKNNSLSEGGLPASSQFEAITAALEAVSAQHMDNIDQLPTRIREAQGALNAYRAEVADLREEPTYNFVVQETYDHDFSVAEAKEIALLQDRRDGTREAIEELADSPGRDILAAKLNSIDELLSPASLYSESYNQNKESANSQLDTLQEEVAQHYEGERSLILLDETPREPEEAEPLTIFYDDVGDQVANLGAAVRSYNWKTATHDDVQEIERQTEKLSRSLDRATTQDLVQAQAIASQLHTAAYGSDGTTLHVDESIEKIYTTLQDALQNTTPETGAINIVYSVLQNTLEGRTPDTWQWKDRLDGIRHTVELATPQSMSDMVAARALLDQLQTSEHYQQRLDDNDIRAGDMYREARRIQEQHDDHEIPVRKLNTAGKLYERAATLGNKNFELRQSHRQAVGALRKHINAGEVNLGIQTHVV
ncbi:MAG: hypothetical protein OXR66_09350 [Candidatus Woesearchaeota archaeon]|nr:hypothetical protein [Candidatus Woesearchaeota archaeon]